MFGTPPSVTAEVFARLPEALRQPPGPSYWSRMQSGHETMASFLEGPSFDRHGNLWVTDIPWGRLFRISPDGRFELAHQYEGEPNGLKFHADGRAFIADHRRGLLAFDPDSGSLESIQERADLDGFKGLNDLHFSTRVPGRVWFTDQGQSGQQDPSGRLFRLDPDGHLNTLMDRLPSPNGLVTNREETVLFLAVTRDNSVWRVPLRPSGAVGRVGRFIQMSGGLGPDGLAIDQAGNLAVCHPGLGSVWLFDPFGEPLLRIRSPEGRMTTNCAFGGPEGRHLYITESESGTILRAECPLPGERLWSGLPRLAGENLE